MQDLRMRRRRGRPAGAAGGGGRRAVGGGCTGESVLPFYFIADSPGPYTGQPWAKISENQKDTSGMEQKVHINH